MKKATVAVVSFALIAFPLSAQAAPSIERLTTPAIEKVQSATETIKGRGSGYDLKTISDHPGPATNLTATQKMEIKAVLDRGKVTSLICTGTILPNQTERMNRIVETRAELACEHAKKLRPEIKVSHQVKVTTRETHNGRVVLLGR